MVMRFYRYILLLFSLVLLFGCDKESSVDRMPEDTIMTPFSVNVETDPLTRVSFDGTAINSGSYVFADGDKLYVSGGDGISGILTIKSGVGNSTATFSGEISGSPTSETDLLYTLVGASQEGDFFTVDNGKVVGSPNYPDPIAYNADVTSYVQNYSHFTASVKYGVRNFTLNQQTVFLNFRIDLLASTLTGSPSTVQVDIKSADGSSTLRRIPDVPVGGSASIASMVFTTVFPVGTSLQGARIVVNNGEGIRCEPDFAADLTLQANKYYTVARTNVEPFTVEAPSSGTGATITYNYGTNTQYKKYSIEAGIGTWGEWTNYSDQIVLSAGEKVSFRGKNLSYNNSDGSKPLFSTTNPVNIYGDIMSLMCDSEWDRNYSVGNNAFNQAFKGLSVNIPADQELILSADGLANSCYKGMFSGCTNLTKAPILPATTLAESCYAEMFKGCNQLIVAPDLPATTSAASCYKSMFEGCTKLTTPPSSLLVTTVEAYACQKMFYGCSNLTSAPAFSNSLSVVEESGCSEMFSGCSKMTTPPPSLPAGTLRFMAYYKMFYDCAKLASIPDFPNEPGVEYDLAAGTSAENGSQNGLCYQMFFRCNSLTSLEGKKLFNSITPLKLGCFNDMFSTCANLTTVPADFLPATTLAASCYRGMFQSCKKLTRAPDLLAATLQSKCYQYMFNTCELLTYIKCYSTSPGSSSYTANWVTNAGKNATEERHFYYRSGVNWTVTNNDGIPSGWTPHPDTVQ